MLNSQSLGAVLVVVLQSVLIACGDAGDGEDTGGEETGFCESQWEYMFVVDQRTSTVDVDLIAGAALGSRYVLALGSDGTLAREDEYGELHAVASSGGLRALALVEPDCVEPGPCEEPIAVAVGDAGVALRSIDGGGAWSPFTVGVSEDLRGIVFSSRALPDETRVTVGVIVGEGVVLRSQDLGASWTPIALGPGETGSLRAVAARLPRVIAVGDGGLAIESNDDGATWTRLDLSTTADLTRVVFDRDRTPHFVTAAGDVITETPGSGFTTIVPAVPVLGLAPSDQIMVALHDDGRLGLWPEDPPLAEPVMLAGRPRALDPSGYGVVVGDAGTFHHFGSHARSDSCGGVPLGRPFLAAGELLAAESVTRDDWHAATAVRLADLADGVRARLAAAWARDATFEHASVAAFARWILELLACGAPPSLVAEAQAAIADEIQHARLCYGLATAYAGRPIGPGALPVPALVPVSSDLSEFATSTFLVGCVGETIAAVEAGYAAESCRDPAVARVLRTIAADELRHAELAWRALAWALERGGQPVRRALAAKLADLLPPRPDVDADVGDPARGRLDAATRRSLAGATLRTVVAPAARRLLARPGHERTLACPASNA